MSNVKVKLNRSGVRALLQSPAMQKECRKQAEQIRSRCGDGYESDVYVGRNRANAMVWAETSAAKRDNLDNNTILKALK